MSGISKRVSGSWVSGNYGIMKTTTDTITTLPADLYADGNNATVGLVGNMYQASGVSPTNPIQPSECGDMSSNMFDITAFVQGIVPNRCTTSYDSTTNTLTINATGNDAHTGNANPYHIPVTGGEIYTLSWITNSQSGIVYIFENGLTDSSHLHSWRSSLNKGTITMQNDTTFIIVRVGCDYANETITYTNIRLNVGETDLPYEPWGIKIPILSGNITTPVYLGEVETTRQIKKLVLTGEEAWSRNSGNSVLYLAISNAKGNNAITSMCTEYPAVANVSAYANMTDKSICIKSDGSAIWIRDTDISSATNFKTHLSQQYAAGTPVTIWYVLATPSTGIVNEPIRKIGNYADTVNGITIPTTAGADSFDVLTTLKPSEVTVNYKGWHPVADVHEKSRNLFDKSKRTDNSRVVYTTGEIGALPSVFVSDWT